MCEHTLHNNLPQLVWSQGQRLGKEKVVTEDCKGVLILEKYKNAQCGNSHGVLQEMPVK